MIATRGYLFKKFNSKRVPQWFIRYEKLFKIIYKISILYLALNILIFCFSLNVWYLVSAIVFFALNKTHLLLVEIVKGLLMGAMSERAKYETNLALFYLSIAVRFFQIILFLNLVVLLILGVRIVLI